MIFALVLELARGEVEAFLIEQILEWRRIEESVSEVAHAVVEATAGDLAFAPQVAQIDGRCLVSGGLDCSMESNGGLGRCDEGLYL